MTTPSEIIALYVLGTIVASLFGISFPIFVAFYRQYRMRNRMQHESELARQRVEVQEQSLTLVSEELHDNIGQLLSFIRRSLSIADEQFGTPKGREQLNNAKAMVTKTLEEVRHISHSLNAELVKTQGIIYLLQQDLESLADSTGIICSLEKKGDYSSWPPEDQLLVYRMLQESMQNVVKHANATFLKLCFNFGPKEIEVTVTDNGQGFDTGTETTNGLGFRNLHHRAAILGATLEMSSERNKGTILYIKIPIKK